MREFVSWILGYLCLTLTYRFVNLAVSTAEISVPKYSEGNQVKISTPIGADRKVNLAVLLPSDEKYKFSIKRIRPVIEVTILKLQHLGMFPRDVIKVMYADSKCSIVYAPIEAFKFMTRPEEVHAFIGPVCDYALAPVARYSSVWGVPVITPGGLAHNFAINKSVNPEYTRLTRTGPNFIMLAQMTQSFMQHYNWTTVVVIYETEGFPEMAFKFCFLAASAMVHFSKTAENIKFDFHIFNSDKADYMQMLKRKVGLELADVKSFNSPLPAV